MPLLKITASHPPSPASQREVLKLLSQKLAAHLGKPESYMMTCWVPEAAMTFGGSDDPVCFVEIKNIGRMSSAQTKAMSADVCESLEQATGVSPKRTYIEFSDAEPHLWGWNAATFD